MWVTLEELKPGMKLAQEVRDPRGTLVAGAGAELSERMLRFLEMAGISGAEVEGGEADRTVDPAVLEALTAQVTEHFSDTDRSHPVVAALFEWAVRRAVRAKGAAASADPG